MRREAKIGIFLTGTLIIAAVFVLFVGDVSTIFRKFSITLRMEYFKYCTPMYMSDRGMDETMNTIKMKEEKFIFTEKYIFFFDDSFVARRN